MNVNLKGTDINIRKRPWRKILSVILLIPSGLLLLSILSHAVVTGLNLPGGNLAEVCAGEMYYYGDIMPFSVRGIWYSAPPVPRYESHYISYVVHTPVVCGLLPRMHREPLYRMRVLWPYNGWYPYR